MAQRAKSRVVRILGPPATGKTTLRRALEERLGMATFAIDELRYAQAPGEKWDSDRDSVLRAWVALEDAADTHNPCAIETSGLHSHDDYLYAGRQLFTVLCVAAEPVRRARLEERVRSNYQAAARQWAYVEKLLGLIDPLARGDITWDTTDAAAAGHQLDSVLRAIEDWLEGIPAERRGDRDV